MLNVTIQYKHIAAFKQRRLVETLCCNEKLNNEKKTKLVANFFHQLLDLLL